MIGRDGESHTSPTIPTRGMAWAFAAFLILLLIGMFVVLALKGLWDDEIFSIYVTRHDLPLADLYRERWRPDVHPPLFHFLFWLTEPLTGTSIVARRALNLVPLLLAGAAAALIARRRPRMRMPVLIAAAIILPSPFAFSFFVEHRAYYIIICAWSVVCLGFAAIALEGRDYDRGDRWLAALIFVGVVLALNLHLVCALMAGVMLGIFLLSEWLQGRRRWAAWLFASGAAGSALLLLAVFMQRQQLEAAGNYLGWGVSAFGAAMRVTTNLVLIFGLNVAALVAALFFFRRFSGGRLADRVRSSGEARFLLTGLLAIAAAVVAVMIVNELHGLILRRYLTPLLSLGGTMVAVAAADRVNASRPLYYAILVNGLVVAAAYAVLGGDRRSWGNWEDLARPIAQEVRACPGTRVVTLPDWAAIGFARPPSPIPDRSLAFGYQLVSSGHGFDPLTFPLETPEISPNCPTIIWSQNLHREIPPPRAIAERAGLALTPRQIAGAVSRRSRTGFMMKFPPP